MVTLNFQDKLNKKEDLIQIVNILQAAIFSSKINKL